MKIGGASSLYSGAASLSIARAMYTPAFGSIDKDLGRAISRTDAEPVSAFVASYSTSANVYVAARYWVDNNLRGVRDLFVFSTGSAVAQYLSASISELVNNPYHRQTKNPDKAWREPLGYVERKPGDLVLPGHHCA